MSNPEIDDDGDKFWRDKNGEFHREDGPAIEFANGDVKWYRHGVIHRDGGPAYQDSKGAEVWYSNGKVHREDGPAMISSSRSHKYWFLDGKRYYKKEEWFEALTDNQKVAYMFTESFTKD